MERAKAASVSRAGILANRKLRQYPSKSRHHSFWRRRGRLMEGLLSLSRMHWDREPWKAPASRTHSKRFAKSQGLGYCAAAFGVRGACSRFRTRFMGSIYERCLMRELELRHVAAVNQRLVGIEYKGLV